MIEIPSTASELVKRCQDCANRQRELKQQVADLQQQLQQQLQQCDFPLQKLLEGYLASLQQSTSGKPEPGIFYFGRFDTERLHFVSCCERLGLSVSWCYEENRIVVAVDWGSVDLFANSWRPSKTNC